MLAVDTAMRGTVEPVIGLVVLSGALICESQWRKAFTDKPLALPLVQSHGRQDPILPIATGRWLQKLLCDAGCIGQLIEFNGQHSIPSEALQETAKLLASLPASC
jgi:phospholipase/carboxylesterase